MISRQLPTVILEAIQEHADHHNHGIIDVDRALSAVGEVASALLAELTNSDARIIHFRALVSGITAATASKILSGQGPMTEQ